MAFELVHGIDIKDTKDTHSAYTINKESIYATFGADIFPDAVEELVKKMDEPVFFFVEIPCSDDEEKQLRKQKSDPYHYKVYYLDNCTMPVAMAILDRYGELLINDGVCRFGFGSHQTGEEIYCQDYQTVSTYGDTDKFKAALDTLDIPQEEDLHTLWETLSDNNNGVCMSVEINGETVADIVSALEAEGMYLADTVEEK